MLRERQGEIGVTVTEEVFYALGQSDWQDFRLNGEIWPGASHLPGDRLRRGPADQQMADSFEQVIAVDVVEACCPLPANTSLPAMYLSCWPTARSFR